MNTISGNTRRSSMKSILIGNTTDVRDSSSTDDVNPNLVGESQRHNHHQYSNSILQIILRPSQYNSELINIRTYIKLIFLLPTSHSHLLAQHIPVTRAFDATKFFCSSLIQYGHVSIECECTKEQKKKRHWRLNRSRIFLMPRSLHHKKVQH